MQANRSHTLPTMSDASSAVLIPAKSFVDAKTRLAGLLSERARHDLAAALLARTIGATSAHGTVYVVSDDDEVLAHAGTLGATVIRCSGPGLNLAVGEAMHWLHAAGVPRVVITHSDLPLIDGLSQVAGHDGAVIVPDRHGQGTNVFAVPTGVDIRWAYGSGSLHRHRAAALRIGLPVKLLTSDRLAFDLDTAADLAEWRRRHPTDELLPLLDADTTPPAPAPVEVA